MSSWSVSLLKHVRGDVSRGGGEEKRRTGLKKARDRYPDHGCSTRPTTNIFCRSHVRNQRRRSLDGFRSLRCYCWLVPRAGTRTRAGSQLAGRVLVCWLVVPVPKKPSEPTGRFTFKKKCVRGRLKRRPRRASRVVRDNLLDMVLRLWRLNARPYLYHEFILCSVKAWSLLRPCQTCRTSARTSPSCVDAGATFGLQKGLLSSSR